VCDQIIMSEEVFKDLIDQINTLKKSNAIANQQQSKINSKLDRIIDLLKDKKNRERERRY
jgi:hypothetical protein